MQIEDLFYSYSVIYILDRLYWIYLRKNDDEFDEKVSSMIGSVAIQELSDMNKQDNRNHPIELTVHYANSMWCIIGFFTPEWRFFVSMLICSLVCALHMYSVLKARGSNSDRNRVRLIENWLKLVICIVLLCHHYALYI